MKAVHLFLDERKVEEDKLSCRQGSSSTLRWTR